MFKRYLNLSNLFITGLLLIIIGIITIIFNIKIFKSLEIIIPIMIFIIGISNLLKFLGNRKRKDRKSILIFAIMNFILLVILLIIPQIPFYLIPMLFSTYLILSGTIKFISFYILRKNNVRKRFHELFDALVCYIIGIIFIFSPFIYAQAVIAILGYYLLLLGFNYLGEYISDAISTKRKNIIKRKIHLSLPKFLLALIPYSVLKSINDYLKINGQDIKVNKLKSDIKPDLEIFIHVTDSGFGMIGHADFYFEGNIYSYGNYDSTSIRLFQLIGDGVLFVTSKREEYINFCIQHSKKTLFSFGISLTEQQKVIIRKRIAQFVSESYVWKLPKVQDKKEKSYAHYLYSFTKPKFYKFKKGKFKTYFTVETNCVKLVDEIVRLDVLNITGIISPGTYFDFLEKEFKRKHSNVVSYNIYNKSIISEENV